MTMSSTSGGQTIYTRVAADYTSDIIGMWEVTEMTGEETYNDDNARLAFLADGTYRYYRKDDTGEWQLVSTRDVEEYFVDGDWLATRWQETDGEMNYEWWDIDEIKDGQMKWSALREREDGTRFKTTFTWRKISNRPALVLPVGDTSIGLVFVKGGDYSMTINRDGTEMKASGTLEDFYIAQTEVTNKLWKAVMGSVPIFRSFIADTTNYVSIGTGNITYMPHDSLGNKQGEIYLTAGGDGCIARITFSDDTPIDRDLVSEIRFIDKKLWPDNDAPRFIVGHIYAYAEDWTKWNNRGDNVQGLFVDITDADVKDQGSDDHYRSHEVGVKFLCVRDESYGNSAMLFWASRKKYAYEWDRVYSYNSQKWAGVWFNDNTDTYFGKFYKNEVRINQIQGEWIIPREPDRSHNCTIEELKTISECLNKDWDKFVKVYGSNRLDDTWYWSSEQAWGPATFRLWAYNLKKGKQDYYRAYTNYWHLSGVTRPYTDCRIIYQSEAEKIKWIFYGDENYLYKQRGGWYKP